MTFLNRKTQLRNRLTAKCDDLTLAQFKRILDGIDRARSHDALDHIDAMLCNALAESKFQPITKE